MSQIMFVEDEISSNVERLITLFEGYLSAEEKEKLQNPPDWGFNGEDIQQILKDNRVLRVYDRFSEALRHIKTLSDDDLNEYDFFILDRNLTGGLGYAEAEIKEIDKSFDSFRYDQKEGDYLALQLQLKGCPLKEKVFFYSAYKSSGFGATEIDQMIEYKSFFKDNFYDKGDQYDMQELKDRISFNPTARLLAEHQEIFKIIKKAEFPFEKKMLELLIADSKNELMVDIAFRSILDNILHYMLRYDCWFGYPKEDEGLGNLINKIHRKKYLYAYLFASNINEMVNEHTAHEDFKLQQPGYYAGRALLNQLLEIIRWCGTFQK